MPFDAADFNWRSDPMPSRPHHWMWDVLFIFKEMAIVLVALLLALSVAFALHVLVYGLPDYPLIGTDVLKLPRPSIVSQTVGNGSFLLTLAGFYWWRWRRMMAE